MSKPTREWVEFEHPTKPGWIVEFDVTFLLSNWNCIYGRGCKGILGIPEHGCCTHGVYTETTLDEANIVSKAEQMTPEEWPLADAFKASPNKHQFVFAKVGKEFKTRVRNGLCIFGTPTGCALHTAALNRKESPVNWKPEVCSTKPFALKEDEQAQVITVRQDTVRDWTAADGYDDKVMSWYCIDKHEAYTADEPIYVTLKDTLIMMIGTPLYQDLAKYLDHVYGPHGKANTSVKIEMTKKNASHA